MNVSKWKIAIIVAGAVVVLLGWAGVQIGPRWYMLHRLYSVPEMAERIAVIPTELDLASVPMPQGKTCHVGFAEFMVPNASRVDLEASGSGTAVLGQSDTLNFGIMPPHNPRSTERMAELQSLANELPPGDPMREAMANGASLDFLVQIQKMKPVSTWDALRMDPTEFQIYMGLLIQKGGNGPGSTAVHTFSTPTARGMVEVGMEAGDTSIAFVSFENPTGRVAVGFRALLPNGATGDVRDVLVPLIKTFRFTVDAIGSKEEVRRLIAGAGITPLRQDQEKR